MRRTVVSNQRFWSSHFRQVFVPQIRALVDTLSDRLLPAFANFETEADQKTHAEYERLISLPARDDIDMADLAEKAFESGLSHYQMIEVAPLV